MPHKDQDIAYVRCGCGRRMAKGGYVCPSCERMDDSVYLRKTVQGKAKGLVECIQGEHYCEKGRFFTLDAFMMTLRDGNWSKGSVWRKGDKVGVIAGGNGTPQIVVWT